MTHFTEGENEKHNRLCRCGTKNEPHAHAVIRKSGIIPAWKNIGAEINLVGSLKIGTLGKHPDIDFHTYTPELDIRQSFAVMAQIAQIRRQGALNL